MTSYNRDYWMAFGAHQKPTAGDMKFSAARNDHLGWMVCDGRTVNVADFQFLFNVIGYSFGGSGSQFVLPNPAGRVPGVIGRGLDSNPVFSTLTLALGSTIGEYQHKLTIPEIPSHNHGVAPGLQSSFNNSTSVVFTGQSLTDPQHKHTGITDNAGWAAASVTTTPLSDAAADNTGNHFHNLLINNNSTGIVLNDPGHAHVLNPAGGDQYHNNIQPTIGMGNMFIYSGRPLWGSYPYTTGKNLW
jgi:microcystin-dependent protein